MANDINERQNVAIAWLIGFGLCLLGILALPIYAGSPSTLEFDGGQIMPLLVLMVILIGVAVIGRTSPVASGLASGVAALLSLALGAAVVFGLIFTVILGDFGEGVEWGGGAAAVVGAAISGVVAVVISARGWGGHSPEPWTPVAVFGSLAILVMVGGSSAPQNGATWGDALGFSVHPVVGLGFSALLAGIAAVGVAGFVMGRWGIGLLTGFLGSLLLSWLAARSGDQAEVASWSGVGQNVEPAAAVGFWCAAGLFVVHVIQQTSTVPVASVGNSQTTVTRDGITAQWAPDPFGRFANRYFDGAAWTNKVSSRGSVEVDEPVAPAPEPVESGWQPDPFRRHEHRYFDGVLWTDDVSDAGQTSRDAAGAHPPVAQSPVLHSVEAPARAPREVSPKPTPASARSTDYGVAIDETVPRQSVAAPLPDVAFEIVSRSGEVTSLAATVIVGRQPSHVDGYQDAALYSIEDEAVSKSHAAFGCDTDGPWVIDLHSLNGVMIEQDPTRIVTPGTRCRLEPGDVVMLGDSSAFEVRRSGTNVSPLAPEDGATE